MYWNDYANSYIEKYYKINIDDEERNNYLYFVFYLNNDGDEINVEKSITINYSYFNKDIKIKVIKLFEKYLLGHFEWNGKNQDSMKIYFDKQKNIKSIKKVKDENMNKYLYIKILTKKNLFEENEIRNLLVKNLYDDIKKQNYSASWDCGPNDFVVEIYSFDKSKNKKDFEKIKKFIDKQTFIKSYNYEFIEE